MDKASGTYLTITDNTFASGGTSVMKFVIPMLTVKGELGLNRVTADTLEEVLGYDLNYNSNYYGLKQILESVAYVDVWRLNQNAKLANAYLASDGTTIDSEIDAETFDDITHITPAPIFAVAAATPGLADTLAVKLSPAEGSETVINNNASTTNPQEIVIADCNATETKTIGETEIMAGATFYNSTDDVLVGVIVYN